MKHLLHTVLIKYSRSLCVLLLTLMVIGYTLGNRLELRLSLTDLLPSNHPSVVKFEKLTEIVGGVGYLIAVLHADDGKSHYKVADAVIPELEKSSLIRTAFYQREKYFFATRMLYYLSIDELNKLESAISDTIRTSRRKAFDIGLWDEEEKKPKEKVDQSVLDNAKEAAEVVPNLISANQKDLLLMIKPTFDSMDIGASKDLLKFTEDTIRKTLPPGVTFELAGRYYQKIEDTNILTEDIFILGTIALVAIALLILVYFGSLRTVFLVLLPVVMGLGLTVGTTYLYVGHINIVTGFLMGIIAGLGMDYSCHMVLRLRLEQNNLRSGENPVWKTLQTGGIGVVLGALTAAFAFFILCLSDFKAFSEFGFICGVGIITSSGCLLLSFSALAHWFKAEHKVPSNSLIKDWRSLPQLTSRKSFLIGLIATLTLFTLSVFVKFDYNFAKLMQTSERVKIMQDLVDAIYDQSVIPSVLATPDRALALEIEEVLKKEYKPQTVETIISGASIIPDDQPKKEVILKRIEKLIRPYKDKWLEKELEIPGPTIRRWVNAKPFTMADLPIHLQDALRGKNNSGYLMYLYAPLSLDLSTGHGIYQFSGMIRDLEKRFPKMLTGSDTVVFAEILDLIRTDGEWILVAIFLVVGFIIWLSVRNFKETLFTYLPLILALPVGIGLMVIFGIHFNIFNITIIPSFVAIGIDVPIHICHRAKQIGSGFQAAKDIAPAVNLSLLTTAIGFGVLIFSRAGVLRSLGWLAVLGTAAIWWVGLFILPAFLEWHEKRAKKKHAH